MPTADDVRFEDGPRRLMAGISRRMSMAEAPTICPQMWQEFAGRGVLPGHKERVMYGLNIDADMASGAFTYMVAGEVPTFDVLEGWDTLTVEPARYAVVTHHGPAGELGATYQWVFTDWGPSAGKEILSLPSYERYGPGYDSATMSGDTELWIPIK